MSDLFLSSVEFRDFRTFGAFEVEIVPAPGLTLLVGTNGLGKSSFFDALEWGLTGEVRRFKDYMGTTNQGKYLTRRGARSGTHKVALGFSDGTKLVRGPSEEPGDKRVVELLKKAAWTAQIQDIGTYLAFTHFLGQAAQTRFTNRERNEQWESLKGPSGIDRLDEVRNGLRGRATELAFNRRIRREKEIVDETARQLTEWRAWSARLTRLQENASASGVLPPDELNRRVDALVVDLAKYSPEDQSLPPNQVSERLSALRSSLEEARRRLMSRRSDLESLADLPERYATQAAAADSNSPALIEAGKDAARETTALSEAAIASEAAREHLRAASTNWATLNAEVERLEQARMDLDDVAHAERDLAWLDTESRRLNAELASGRVELQALEDELKAIQGRMDAFAGLTATAQMAGELAILAQQLSSSRAKAKASSDAQFKAESKAAIARQELDSLTAERDRLVSELGSARASAEGARSRASAVTAAVAAIASHLHEDDVDCPVCKTKFQRGSLRLLAEEAANSQDAALAAAESKHTDLNRQLNSLLQRIAANEAVLGAAENARKLAAADAGDVADLERRLEAALPGTLGDLVIAAVEAKRRASLALSEAQAEKLADESRRSEVTVRLNDIRPVLGAVEHELSALREKVVARTASKASHLERLAAAGHGDLTTDRLDAILQAVREKHSAAIVRKFSAEESLRQALEAETATRSRLVAVNEVLHHAKASKEAAAAGVSALQSRWRESGLSGVPEAATLEAALLALAGTSREFEQMVGRHGALVTAYEASIRDQDLKDLVAEMTRVGGKSSVEAPGHFEIELLERNKEAITALEVSESAHQAVNAFADKLRDEAREFSTQFLTPLNGLIDDFNEALLSMPGESVRLNAAYHKDRTQFDMGLRYRDPLDDVLYDTDLPPQVVLSEGQLAANGFSILCSASTAYPWSRWRSLLMDDPLQHNDIIHAAAFVDLMRNLVELQNYQLVMSSHDRGEAEFIRRKFDAAGLPCSLIALTAPSRSGVRYLAPDHNAAARSKLISALARTG